MKIALFGKTGQVATEVQRRASGDVEVQTFDREQADFRDPDAISRLARSLDADAIINAVAYTAVEKAEVDKATADLVNHLSVRALAATAADRKIPLVHISTDYIFDGSGTQPRPPEAPASPLGVYGATKLAGEQAVRDCAGTYVILRTSWVFSAHGSNFLKTMLRLAKTHGSLRIVADQIGGPTPASAIAAATIDIARALSNGQSGGTYHFTGSPDASWSEFAREIFRQSGARVDVTDIATADYPTSARRPLNSCLDCESLARDFGVSRPDWRVALADVLKELGAT